MKAKQIIKTIGYYCLSALILTLIWNVALHAFIFPNFFTKTQVTVISLDTRAPAIRGDGRQTTTFPTYEYLDSKGELRTYESRDGYNVFNSFLFEKKVGDEIEGFYENDSKNGIFIPGTGDWLTFLAAPLIFAVFPGTAGLVVYIILKSRR
jgi:hypothetical protein